MELELLVILEDKYVIPEKRVDPDSCLNCKFGYIKKGVNDWCCQEKEKEDCTQLKKNADGTQSYKNKGGSMCDTTKKI